MKVYRYDPTIYGDGGARIIGPNVEMVDAPSAADVLLCPQFLFALHRDAIAWARFWNEPEVQRRPECVVVMDCSDDFPVPPVAGAIYLRPGLTRAQQARYPSAVAIGWPAPDLGRWRDAYAEQPFMWDVGFCGWATPMPTTTIACVSVERAFGTRARCVVRREFHGHRERRAGNHRPGEPCDDPENEQREREYRDILYGSRLSLVPESIPGVARYRINESLAASRVPVWIGSGYVLPFADQIPWAEICLFVETADAERAGDICAAWLADRSDNEIRCIGERARRAWEQWLDPARWPEAMTRIVAERRGFLP